MEAIICNFRGGKHSKSNNQMIIKVSNINTKEKAKELIGKTVTWASKGKNPKTIKGKITNLHGNSGCLRVLFEKGMPGQSITQKVKWLD